MDERIEIVHVAMRHGNAKPIKVADELYRAYCPFCNDDIPSLFMDTSLQEYHCFHCGRGGNVTNFIMEKYNTDFFGAVNILSGKEANSKKAKKELEVYYRMNIDAANFFHENLIKDDNEGMRYFKERGLSDATITRFGLGYIGKNGLYKHLSKDKKYKPQNIEANSLARKNDKRYYDFFYNRVIIPILDVNNQVIGFGGRVLDDSKPKYINSGQSPVFDKRLNLFALNFAHKSNREGLILCEGYMDVMSLHQNTFDNAVASLGTALTEEQVYIISRFTNHVYIAYDSDDAGNNATEEAVKLLRKRRMIIRRIDLSDTKDPDEFIKKYGAVKFQNQINHARYL